MAIWKVRLAGGFVLLLVASLNGSLRHAVLGLAVGAVGGFLLEYVGVLRLNLWSYTGRFPKYGERFPKGEAFLHLVVSWGLIGMVAALLWQWVSIGWLAFLLSFLFPILCWEVPNIRRKSWQYRAPAWLVLAGWLLTLLVFRGVFVAVP